MAQIKLSDKQLKDAEEAVALKKNELDILKKTQGDEVWAEHVGRSFVSYFVISASSLIGYVGDAGISSLMPMVEEIKNKTLDGKFVEGMSKELTERGFGKTNVERE